MIVGPCYHGMAFPQVVEVGSFYNMKGSANILNKQSRTAECVCPSNLGVGRGANNHSA